MRVCGTRKWPIHHAKKSTQWLCVSGSVMSHSCLKYAHTDSSKHPSNRTIGKRIRFVKETFRFVQFVRIVSSSVDWYDHFWSTACSISLAAQVASRNAEWREVRLHLITGTPNDLMLQNNCYKEQIEIYYLEIPKSSRKAKTFWKNV